MCRVRSREKCLPNLVWAWPGRALFQDRMNARVDRWLLLAAVVDRTLLIEQTLYGVFYQKRVINRDISHAIRYSTWHAVSLSDASLERSLRRRDLSNMKSYYFTVVRFCVFSYPLGSAAEKIASGIKFALYRGGGGVRAGDGSQHAMAADGTEHTRGEG